ncbi:MAG: glutathione S-transferase N-terminal domain-containing protein [Paracoccaceae bacterium]
MKLYFSPTSPYVRKVMLVLYLRRLTEKVQLVTANTTPTRPDKQVLAHNPLGKVPALVTDEGEALYDSRVICRYLDEFSGGGLYPTDERAFGVLRREALADGLLDAGLLAIDERRLRPEAQQSQQLVDAWQAKITRALGAFEAEAEAIRETPERIDHLALAAALGYLDFRFSGMGWRREAPEIAEWFEDYRETPAMLATAPRS